MTIQVRSNEKPTPTLPPPAVSQQAGENLSKVTGESKETTSQSEQTVESKETTQQNESQESETGETVSKEGENEDHPKKKGGFQRRIDKLNSQKAQAQQEVEFWKQQALQAASATKSQTPPKTEPTPIFNQESKPKPEDFETHSEYVESLADWKMETKLKERDIKVQKEQFDREQNKAAQTYQEKVQSFSAKTPDFQEILADVDHIQLSPALRDIILSSENGPELTYLLAKNPAEFERIAKLTPLACAREVGKFEERTFTPKSVTTEGKKITHAPRPIEPVGTGGKGSVAKSIHDPGLSQREYETLRKEQIKKRRQAS